MSTVRSRWLKKLNTARLWERIQRRRYIWHPTAENRRKLTERRAQIHEAERVLKRHPAEPRTNPARGIDVSNNQGSIDFKAVKRAGYDFVYVKAGEGDWKDPTFASNVKAATAAGLHVGAYQFARPRAGRTGAQEAALFVARLRDVGLGKNDLRPALDIEVTALDRVGTHRYVESFLSGVRAAGLNPIIYTGTWFWDPKVGAKVEAPLWIAAYQANAPKLPMGWTRYVIWQYTDRESVPGVGKCDANRCPDLNAIIQH